MAAAGLSREDLEKQAEEMALKALPPSLPAAARALKLPVVKQKILERLLAQSAPSPPACGPSVVAPGAAPPATVPSGAAVASIWRPSPPPPPTPDQRLQQLKVNGAELYGDEPWFEDELGRARARASVADAHREQRILVGSPAEEVDRICPDDGRTLGSGAVLRLGGALHGGYGEGDVAYAYRQLSRALHPDKNPGLARAQSAFHRLSEAADELRRSLGEQRQALQIFAAATGQPTAAEETVERPQEALFAEVSRLLAAVCGLSGEGQVPKSAERRTPAAFTARFPRCSAQQLLTEWFQRDRLLQLLATSAVRSAYDAAPKRYRAQFLCMLNRALCAEAKRSNGAARERWSAVAKTFPEVALWCELRRGIGQRLWESSTDGAVARGRSRSPQRARRSMWGVREVVGAGGELTKWARKWRTAIAAVLPSGEDGAVPATDAEVRKLAYVLWRDVATWAADQGDECERALALFRARGGDASKAGQPSAEWAFVPISDLLLVVGDGKVGITAEGVFADNPSGHARLSLAECYRKKASVNGSAG